jgi:ABC-type proline/glycine betaine transport system permease subunit
MVVILQWLEQRTWKHSVSGNSTERHCKGFESGLGIVILAIILDRTTQAIKKIITENNK